MDASSILEAASGSGKFATSFGAAIMHRTILLLFLALFAGLACAQTQKDTDITAHDGTKLSDLRITTVSWTINNPARVTCHQSDHS
jgi:hypothetical protein